jgi:osmotically-inducible protein OsmY
VTAGTTTRIDEDIQRDVLEELKWDARVQPNEIGVAVKDGIVTLTGWVDSYVKRWAAERAALRVRGVKAVVNDIAIRLPGSAERTDADLAAEALRALQWDALIPTERIKVTVKDGWVTLRGEVEWEYQKRAAERDVRRLAGVRGVTNLITVHPRVIASAEELKHRIEQALVRNAETDARHISVHIEDRTVVLTGTVHSWWEREEAERVAWSAPGVVSVDNRIVVEPVLLSDDED